MIDSGTIDIYRIIHIDRLSSIIADGYMWSDAIMQTKPPVGTDIGMHEIKRRRLEERTVACYLDLNVGQCVPFYFGTRSVMLYKIHKNTPNDTELLYHGGQENIIYLVLNMNQAIEHLTHIEKLRWAFTDVNAAAVYCNFYSNLSDLDKLNWTAIHAQYWSECRDQKQAEFLIENKVAWHLVNEIVVYSSTQEQEVNRLIANAQHKPKVTVNSNFYY